MLIDYGILKDLLSSILKRLSQLVNPFPFRKHKPQVVSGFHHFCGHY